MLDAPQDFLLLIHFNNILTYCVVYKHCYMLMLNKIYCIILYRILDDTMILSMDKVSKIYHILFKPAVNYNCYADTIQE